MLDTFTQALPQGSFAIVAFALSIFNFVVSLWTIMSIRAGRDKGSAGSTASRLS
jgi:hypothetical protein